MLTYFVVNVTLFVVKKKKFSLNRNIKFNRLTKIKLSKFECSLSNINVMNNKKMLDTE
jgi:hypothetical protein